MSSSIIVHLFRRLSKKGFLITSSLIKSQHLLMSACFASLQFFHITTAPIASLFCLFQIQLKS